MLLELIEGNILFGDDCVCDGTTSCRQVDGGCGCREECGLKACPCKGAIAFVVPVPI